jgi:hypothetical protein
MGTNRKRLLGVVAVAALGVGCTPPPSSSYRPLLTIPASPATVQATGVKQWRLHGYRNGTTHGLTLVGVDSNAQVATATRLFSLQAGTRRVAAVASLYPSVGRLRFDTTKVVETSLSSSQSGVYTRFKSDFDHYRSAGKVPYDCTVVSAALDAAICAGAVVACAEPVGWVICLGGAAACAKELYTDIQDCNKQQDQQKQQQQQQQQDPNMMMAGMDPNNMDPNNQTNMDPNNPNNDPNNQNNDPNNPNNDPNNQNNDPNNQNNDPNNQNNDPSYDPNGDFGAGTDVASCSDCSSGFDDSSS